MNETEDIGEEVERPEPETPIITKDMLAPLLASLFGERRRIYPGRYQHRNQSEATLEKAQAKRNRKARKRLESLR